MRRYTELPFLVDFLMTRELALLNPISWDDRNDSYYIEQYVAAQGFKKAFALCLAESPETYHHWKVFSHGSGGVCIEFDKDKFMDNANKVPGLRAEPVQYRTIKALRENAPDQEQLPFLKRIVFEHEKEFRLFLGTDKSLSEVFRIKMPLTSVDRITLSPWLPNAVANNVKKTLKAIDGCSKIKIYKSTLVENENWKKFATNGV
ncbi:MAG: DUF2971 domain-containing protein [Candidatus Thiodiazotropha sp.]